MEFIIFTQSKEWNAFAVKLELQISVCGFLKTSYHFIVGSVENFRIDL